MSDLAQRNKQLILDHFEELINRKDLDAIERNLAPMFRDHDGPGGRTEREAERPMIAQLHEMMPDVRVEVRDAVAEGDLVIVRNVWSGTKAATGERMQCHGFVMWRIADGKIVERWATVTLFAPMAEAQFTW